MDKKVEMISIPVIGNLLNITMGACLAISKGDFNELKMLPLQDGRNIVTVNESYYREHIDSIYEIQALSHQ